MLNKHNLDIAVIAGKSKWGDNGLFVAKDRTVANDGRRLVEITRPTKLDGEEFNPDDFPVIPNFEPKQDHDFIIPTMEALKVAKQIPKGKRTKAILKNAVIEQNGRVRIASTDLGSAIITDINPIEGKYPEYQQVIPQGKLKHRVGVNPKYLMEICQLADKFQSEYYKIMVLEFNDNGGIKLTTKNDDTGQEFTAIVMPMSLKEED